jgi:hypothetical protein
MTVGSRMKLGELMLKSSPFIVASILSFASPDAQSLIQLERRFCKQKAHEKYVGARSSPGTDRPWANEEDWQGQIRRLESHTFVKFLV